MKTKLYVYLLVIYGIVLAFAFMSSAYGYEDTLNSEIQDEYSKADLDDHIEIGEEESEFCEDRCYPYEYKRFNKEFNSCICDLNLKNQ